MRLPAGTALVAGALGVSGVVHLVRPEVFEPLIPRQLGDPTPWVYATAVPELASAAGLLAGARWAPGLATATLAVIWVGNVQMALDVQRSRRPGWQKLGAWLRVPLQVPMMRATWTAPVAQRGS